MGVGKRDGRNNLEVFDGIVSRGDMVNDLWAPILIISMLATNLSSTRAVKVYDCLPSPDALIRQNMHYSVPV